jgi:hypothetical protein
MRRHRREARARVGTAAATGLGLAALGYAAWIAATWARYGHTGHARDAGAPDDPLDEFMPDYEVSERHEIAVDAPAEVTFAAARAMDVNRSPVSRAIFAARTLPARLLGHEVERREPRSLVDETQALGWRVLAEVPGRRLVMGAVTQPWQPNVTFHGLPPEEFRAFATPGWAKIVWTLEAEPLGATRSRFRTRTRVCTTDPVARARFRRYWAVVSPGILLIRRASLGLVRAEALRRVGARAGRSTHW